MTTLTSRGQLLERYELATCDGDCIITLDIHSEMTDIRNPYEFIEFYDTVTGAKLLITRQEFESASKALALINLKAASL